MPVTFIGKYLIKYKASPIARRTTAINHHSRAAARLLFTTLFFATAFASYPRGLQRIWHFQFDFTRVREI